MEEASQPRTFGDYVVDRELGRGGMGVVFAATHRELGKRVAIKVLLGEVSRDADAVERFKNEARAASAIEHPSIVEIHTVGQVDDVVYIVMELLQGQSLAARLKARGAMPIGDAVAIARQVANALDAAHRVGIVHRDLKPDNVYLVPDVEVPGGERVKLLDFGIAKLVGEGLSTAPTVARTVTGAILGTPHYMSPEQCEGAREVDARSDLYSLGCMLFQMVSGRLPFVSAGVGGLIGMHLHVPPPVLRSVRPDAPEELEQVIARLLAKAPEDRIQTAAEVAAELRNLSTTTSQSSLPQIPPPVAKVVDRDVATIATMMAPPSAKPAAPAPAPKRGRWIAIGAGVLIVGVAVAVITSRRTVEVAPRTTVTPPAPEKPPEKQPDNSIVYELQVGRRMIKTDDLAGAEKQASYLLEREPTNREVLAFQVEVDDARAKKQLIRMREAATARNYEKAWRSLDTVKRLTKDSKLHAEAEAIWKPLRDDAIAAVRAKVEVAVAAGHCATARTAARFGEELGESFAADYARCETKRAAAEKARAEAREHDRNTAEILKRIDTQPLPIHIAQACAELLAHDVAKVPWDRCVLAACQSNPASVYSIINRAPAADRNRLSQICPQKR